MGIKFNRIVQTLVYALGMTFGVAIILGYSLIVPLNQVQVSRAISVEFVDGLFTRASTNMSGRDSSVSSISCPCREKQLTLSRFVSLHSLPDGDFCDLVERAHIRCQLDEENCKPVFYTASYFEAGVTMCRLAARITNRSLDLLKSRSVSSPFLLEELDASAVVSSMLREANLLARGQVRDGIDIVRVLGDLDPAWTMRGVAPDYVKFDAQGRIIEKYEPYKDYGFHIPGVVPLKSELKNWTVSSCRTAWLRLAVFA